MKTVLAIAAHPDDIEFLMAGTLILLRRAGYEMHYWTLANGSCGTTEYGPGEIAAIRREEAKAAAEALGAHFHESICNDLEVFYDQPTLAKVASVIRNVQPDILLTHSPTDYLEDHTNTCRLAVTGAFSRGMPNFPVDPPRDAISKNVVVYHAQPYSHRNPLGDVVQPHFFVDVSDIVEQKVDLLAKHQSQKQWLDESQGLDSYLQTLRELDAFAGKLSGRFDFAEGWRRHLHLGFCGSKDNYLVEDLPASLVAYPEKEAV